MIAGVADSVGFESLWLWDHLLGLWHTEAHEQIALAELLPEGDAFFDPYVLATGCGQHWNGAIGTGVTCTTRRHPVVTAQCALSAQHFLPSGEFILGVGSGEAEGTVPYGYEYGRPVGRFEEAVQIIRHFFDSTEPLDFKGEHFVIDGGRMALRPPEGKPRPQIWGAAHGPRMLDICGRYCDGWLPAFPQPPEEYAARAERIRAAAREAGRPDPIMAAMFFPVSGESREKVVRDANADPLFKSVGLMISDEWLQRYAGTFAPRAGQPRHRRHRAPPLLARRRARSSASPCGPIGGSRAAGRWATPRSSPRSTARRGGRLRVHRHLRHDRRALRRRRGRGCRRHRGPGGGRGRLAAGPPAGPSSPVSHNDQGVSHVGCAMGRGERSRARASPCGRAPTWARCSRTPSGRSASAS